MESEWECFVCIIVISVFTHFLIRNKIKITNNFIFVDFISWKPVPNISKLLLSRDFLLDAHSLIVHCPSLIFYGDDRLVRGIQSVEINIFYSELWWTSYLAGVLHWRNSTYFFMWFFYRFYSKQIKTFALSKISIE